MVTGFVLILAAVAGSWVIEMRQMDGLAEVMVKSRKIARKMDIVAMMTEISRTRSRLTMQMIITDDIWERDDVAMELNQSASEFAVLRTQLFDLGLNQKERSLFESQAPFITAALMPQREAADLAMTGEERDRQRAAELIVEQVYPNQGQIVDHFMQLLAYQKSQMELISEQALRDLKNNRAYNHLMVGVVALIMMSILFITVRSLRKTEQQLVLEKEKAQVTLRSIGDGVITLNSRGEIEYLNEVALNILRLPKYHLVGRHFSTLFDDPVIEIDQQGEAHIQTVIEMALEGRPLLNENRELKFSLINRPDSSIKATVSPIVDFHHHVSGVVISFSDVTKSEALLHRIQHQASHDELTGLLNRRAFEEKVRQMLELYEGELNHAFCMIDLDQFKIVNDTAGHAAGDELLRQLGQIMKPVLRKTDLLGRLGGDEFGAFIPNVTTHEAVSIAEKLLDAVHGFGFYWEDNVYRVGASIGIVDVPADVIDYEYLYQAADSACYIAKNEGRNRIHLMPLDAEILGKKVEDSQCLKELTQTLDENRFLLFGQSIVGISERASGRNHVEILLRMKARDGSLVPPMSFIPIAERYGLMGDIDYWVMRQVCRHIVDSPISDVIYTVNLSGQTLSSRDRMQGLLELITEFDIPPQSLCLEITETFAIANLDLASQFMHAFRKFGCYVALDDFGSGLSSFSYLSSLPLDYIKIDGIFVKSMHRDKASRVMIEAIHHVGQKLGMLTIAEYVENSEDVETLKNIGIDMAQGYYFSKPALLITP